VIPAVGDRVRMVGLMPDDPDPIEVGTEGTVTGIGGSIGGRVQIFVEWDTSRSLILLDTDPFVRVASGPIEAEIRRRLGEG